tara:strand:+ start:680 stop:2515 length:1836 start_codon:yes stop_codon:yes gene_type:complete
MNILGLSAYYHDSSACILIDGEIIAAVQEERFTRIKHDSSFPSKSIQYCIKEAGIDCENIDYVVFYEKPFLKFERLLETYLAFAPRGFKSFTSSLPVWVKEKLFQKSSIINELNMTLGTRDDWKNKLLFSEHHLSHAASAFYPSPFEEAAILTMDGVGEWTTTSLAIGKLNSVEVLKEIHFPHSLGLLYSAFTYYTGFKVNSGEYKVMGLAPYGMPKYVDKIKNNLIDIKEDGSFFLDMSYFDYCTGLTMTNKKFADLFDGPPRDPESELSQKEMDLAASIQVVTEEIVLKLANRIRIETGLKNLCLAGGVALNCVANGKLLKSGIFDDVWVQPAAGDAGGALGAALAIHHMMLDNPRKDINQDNMRGSYLGPKFSEAETSKVLDRLGAIHNKLSEDGLFKTAAEALASGKAIGWMNGRMEYGPRALGARSIIADSRSPTMQKMLNLKVKYRESFRPFAPSILKEELSNWFELDKESPYMLMVSEVCKDKRLLPDNEDESLFGIEKLNIPRSKIPAVTHIDFSARVQTVDSLTNPRYHKLIKQFFNKTGCPVLVNTSFNVRGEPIVCNPEDAFKCFMGTELDILIIDNIILYKEEQDPALKEQYETKYELD